jgi:hypothetical protein
MIMIMNKVGTNPAVAKNDDKHHDDDNQYTEQLSLPHPKIHGMECNRIKQKYHVL